MGVIRKMYPVVVIIDVPRGGIQILPLPLLLPALVS